MLARRGRLEPVFAAGLVKQASLGLEKAHAAGIIHRDLKPANVFLVERDDGTTLVKLVDFGIAKIVRDAEDARFARKGITRRGTAIGTPQYMSPERRRRSTAWTSGRTFLARRGPLRGHRRPAVHARAADVRQKILQLVSTRPPRLSSIVPNSRPRSTISSPTCWSTIWTGVFPRCDRCASAWRASTRSSPGRP